MKRLLVSLMLVGSIVAAPAAYADPAPQASRGLDEAAAHAPSQADGHIPGTCDPRAEFCDLK